MDDQSLLFTMLWSVFMLFYFPNLTPKTQPPLHPPEQQALYQLLNSLNPTIPWTTLFPDDLCLTATRFALCHKYYHPSHHDNKKQLPKSHIVQLTFGYISDQTPLPPCSPNATLNPLLFTSFPYLQKLSFYKCFNHTQNPINLTSLPSLQELVFIDNPSIVSPLQPFLQNLTSLKTLILIGNGFYGEIPCQIGNFHDLVNLTLSRNNLSGEVPTSIGMLKKLEILDLSHNEFRGCVPEQIGNLISLLKLNLSHNEFGCKIPDSFINLKNLEVLDLSFNHFDNFGIPLFLREFSKMKELHLSGNTLSGKIPEIWKKLGGVEKIGFSKMGLIGELPASMGVYLKNLSYLGLDSNNLDGSVPEKFGLLLKFVNEINLENNNLSGRITFCGVGQKLKLAGNIGLDLGSNDSCSCENEGSLDQLNRCKTTDVLPNGVSLLFFDPHMLVLVLIMIFVFIGF